MDLISILMPVYNVEPYIEEAVNSILNQTYENFELIIVDDCSTDNTYKILEIMSQKDKRIKLYKNKINSKICKTLNRALELSTGDFIARMDGDDISETNRLEILKKYLDDHKECSLVGSQIVSINEKGKLLSYKKYLRTNEYIKKYMSIGSTIPHFWLARRNIYITLGGYRDIPFAEDYDFIMRGKNRGYNFANVEEYLYKMRIRQGNTGSTNGLKQHRVKRLVQRMAKKEKTGKNIFTPKMYTDAITTSKKAEKSFSNAYRHLNNAIQNRNDKFYLIRETILSMFMSPYIAEYIISASLLRFGIWCEDKKYKRCKL